MLLWRIVQKILPKKLQTTACAALGEITYHHVCGRNHRLIIHRQTLTQNGCDNLKKWDTR
jgi:hypothetical protein